MDLNNLIIAGCLPVSTSHPAEEVAFRAAEDALKTPNLHLLARATDTHVFFFAIPSVQASIGAFDPRLAAALPQHPAHQGDGFYVSYVSSEDATAAVKRGNDLRIIMNAKADIEGLAEREALPIFEVESLGAEPWPLESSAGRARRAGHLLANYVLAGATVWALTACVAAAVLSAYVRQDEKAVIQPSQQLQGLLNQLQLVQPMTEDLASLQHVSAIVLKSGGYLEGYRQDEKGLSYILRLPKWTTKSSLDELGPQIRTSFDAEHEEIVVTRGVAFTQKGGRL